MKRSPARIKRLEKKIERLGRQKLRAECDLRFAEWQLKREKRRGR
jgi:hypothetical protein